MHGADDLKIFGEQLQALRLSKGWSQEKLALVAEIDRTYVSSVERGRRNISLLNILRLAKALGVPASHLLETTQGERGE